MRKLLLLLSCFASLLLITSCGKEEAAPTLEGVYDIIYYSTNNCGGENITLDTDKESCSKIGEYEFCLGGTLSLTTDLFTIDLKLTVDGELDGEKVESAYTADGNVLSICTELDDCETAEYSLNGNILEITSTDEDGCNGVLRGRKR